MNKQQAMTAPVCEEQNHHVPARHNTIFTSYHLLKASLLPGLIHSIWLKLGNTLNLYTVTVL